jgi:hypothetical protein
MMLNMISSLQELGFALEDAVELPVLAPSTRKMLLELGTSGFSVGIATACTNPIDVVKVRIQLAGPTQAAGIVGTGAAIVRTEGVTADVLHRAHL